VNQKEQNVKLGEKKMELTRRAYWIRMASVAAVVALITYVHMGIVIPMTPSVKYHVLLESSGVPAKGDYVDVDVFHAGIDQERAVRLTKRIACVAGEVLRYENGRHYCGNDYLGVVLKRTSKGLPLQAFEFNGVIPAGKVFLVGDHERSFDSRYIGLVNESALTRLTPIF
jgi:conjugal transfer pilin signal peptidase TrbI